MTQPNGRAKEERQTGMYETQFQPWREAAKARNTGIPQLQPLVDGRFSVAEMRNLSRHSPKPY